MATDKTAVYGFPVPAYDYGAGTEAAAVGEYTSSMSAAASAVLAAINTTSNALSADIANRVSVDNVLSNNISVVSAAIAAAGNANVVSAQLASVSAVLAGEINTISNTTSGLSNQVSTLSVQAAGVIIKAINTANQASISVSTPVTVSGVSLPVVAGSTYHFQFAIPFTSKNLAGGISMGVAGPAMTSYVARMGLPTAGTALATVYTFGMAAAIGGVVSAASTALSGTTLMAFAEGYANPSGSGSLHCTISITAAGTASTITVLKGAQGRAVKLS